MQARELSSPTAISYKQRFEKTGAKMFMFLDYDGVPWNNNHAEHAIKRFAKYRRLFDGLYTEDTLNEYLILASILTTCEFNNLTPLNFLLSEEKSLDGLLRTRQTRSLNTSASEPCVADAQIAEPSQISYLNTTEVTSSSRGTVQVTCKDSNWKERCKTCVKAHQETEVTDFDADAGRYWAHNLARKYGARCQVRKRISRVFFSFTPSD